MFQSVWETLRCSIYNFKNQQLPNFHIVTPQIPICKAPKPFLIWLSIQCHGVYEKVANVKTGAKQGNFWGSEFFLELGHFNKQSPTAQKKKGPTKKFLRLFLLENPKNCTLNKEFNP